MTWAELLAIGQLVALIASIIGGYFGLRSVLAKSAADVQERVRAALHDENELLQSQVKRLEKELVHVQALMRLLIDTLEKHRNLKVEINGDSISIHEGNQTVIANLPGERP